MLRHRAVRSRRSTAVVVECLLPMPKPPSRVDLLQGTLDLLVLQTLQWGPQHGHGIKVAISSSSNDVLQIDHGSLYPALHRLEKQGWLVAEWKLTENKQRAKYYRLTVAGRRQLRSERSRWQVLSEAISRVLDPA